MRNTSPPIFSPALLQQLDINGPRYTSYPTADRFHDGFDATAYARTLAARRELAAHNAAAPLSLYVHIPFCESVCYYCACNKVITRHHERAADYLRALDTEIELHLEALGGPQAVSQLHFGGGSPTFLSDAELAGLMASLARAFTFVPDAELSIEVDPRTVDAGWRRCASSASTASASGCRISTRRCRRRCIASRARPWCARWSSTRARSASRRSTPT
jgi:oxygen-independent coproporphyrinogen III oxidase